MISSWLIVLLVGAIIGWLMSLFLGNDTSSDGAANVGIGVVGALLGRWLFTDVLGMGQAELGGHITLAGLVWGIVGSFLLIALVRVQEKAR